MMIMMMVMMIMMMVMMMAGTQQWTYLESEIIVMGDF
jgi:hypothetical protein